MKLFSLLAGAACCAMFSASAAEVIQLEDGMTTEIGGKQSDLNVAKGKKVFFSTPPANPGTAEKAMTDGIITLDLSKANSCATFSVSVDDRLYVCVDLEKPVAIDKALLYIITNTGTHWRYSAPRLVKLLISQDGKEFYQVGAKAKVGSYGVNIPKGAEPYKLTEVGEFRSFPLEFSVNGAEARYVGFEVRPEGFTFKLDEIAVFPSEYPQDTGATAERKIYGADPVPFYIGNGLAPYDKFMFGPLQDELAVPKNALIPGTLIAMAYDGKKYARNRENAKRRSWPRRDDIEFVIDLPEGIKLYTETPNMKASKVTFTKEDGRNIYKLKVTEASSYGGPVQDSPAILFRADILSPIFFQAEKDFNGEDVARFYVIDKGVEYSARTLPVRTFEMPLLKKRYDDRIHLSDGWMWPRYIFNWPGFYETYGKLGFNGVPIYPNSTYERNESLPWLQKIVKDALEHNYKIVSVSSPLHGIRIAKFRDCVCTGTAKLCPSYVLSDGAGYIDEMERIAKCVAMYPHDFVFYDCEMFGGVASRMAKCERCTAMIKETGKKPEEIMKDCGRKIISDWQKYYKKYMKTENDANLGIYYFTGTIGSFQGVFDFNDYPKNVKYTMPEFYGAGRVSQAHWFAKKENQKTGGNFRQITWLSTGTFGEFPPFKVELLTLELLMNGSGITFFYSGDFDTPEDYRYFTEALKTLEPYQELLINGKLYKWEGRNKRLYYTVNGNDSKMLLLVGNYTSDREEHFKIERLPMDGNIKIREVTKNGFVERKAGETVKVIPQGYRLFELSK